jgi:hypothetical protein
MHRYMEARESHGIWDWGWPEGRKSTHRTAMLATREESSPPDSSTPSGTSDISRFTTALISVP